MKKNQQTPPFNKDVVSVFTIEDLKAGIVSGKAAFNILVKPRLMEACFPFNKREQRFKRYNIL